MGLATFRAIFFTNSSGHTGRKAVVCVTNQLSVAQAFFYWNNMAQNWAGVAAIKKANQKKQINKSWSQFLEPVYGSKLQA
jgi:hypothetical protein